jgi:hypothetical protein
MISLNICILIFAFYKQQGIHRPNDNSRNFAQRGLFTCSEAPYIDVSCSYSLLLRILANEVDPPIKYSKHNYVSC